MICSAGPPSQLRDISQFVAWSIPGSRAYLSLGGHAISILRRLFVPMSSPYRVGLQPRARHKGIGSVPSARITFCSARIPGAPGAVLFGIAQYIPANANAVSRISIDLFIGGASEKRGL